MEDLQELLEKINKDGVEKAEQEAKKIVDAAKKQASALIEDARARADAMKKEAEEASRQFAAHAEETIRQGSRDTILKLKGSIEELLEKILLKNVEKSLADEATVQALVASALREMTGPTEITVGAKLAAALKAELASQGQITVLADDARQSGFSVKTDGGRVESAFTAEVVAHELAERLRPELAKIIEG